MPFGALAVVPEGYGAALPEVGEGSLPAGNAMPAAALAQDAKLPALPNETPTGYFKPMQGISNQKCAKLNQHRSTTEPN